VRYQYTGRRDQPADKQAEILASAGVSEESAAEMISDFNLGRAVNPRLGYPVWHTSLSFNPDDAVRLNSDKMRAIAEGYLQKMGLDNTQYVIVRHHDQPDNQHLHIIANRVGYDGKTIDDGRNFYRSKLALQELIAEHDLTPIKGQRPELQHPERLRGTDLARQEMLTTVNQAVAAETQRPQLVTALRAAGIEVEERFDKAGKATGISFEKDGYKFKGSELGRHLSSAGIDKQLAVNEPKQQTAAVASAVKTDPTSLMVPAAGSATTPISSAKAQLVKESGATVGQPATGASTASSTPMVESSVPAGRQVPTTSQEVTNEQASVQAQAAVPAAVQAKEPSADQEARATRAAHIEEMRRQLDLETEKLLAHHLQRPLTYVIEAKSDQLLPKLSTAQNDLQPGKVQKSESSSINERPLDGIESPAATPFTRQLAPSPLVSEGTSASKLSPEVILPSATHQAVATQVEESALHPVVPAAVGQLSSTPIGEPAVVPSPVVGLAPSVPIQEREAQLPVVKTIPQQPVVAANPTGVTGPAGELTEAGKSVASREPLGPAVLVAGGLGVEPVAQPLQSQEPVQKQLPMMSLAEKLISELPDRPATIATAAPVVVTAPVVSEVAEAAWQHGIIRMQATEKRTSEERLNAVRAALLAAGATVGAIVPPIPGRHAVPLLPYSFDPATTSLAKVNQVLDDVQTAGNSKVQEQSHPLHQPTSAPKADNVQWPDREGQFNQAHVLIDDSTAGQARANTIANELRSVGASVGKIQRNEQGLVTMQVSYHTYATSIDAINNVLDSVNNSSSIEVQESQQNRDARYMGAVQVDIKQAEASAGNEQGT